MFFLEGILDTINYLHDRVNDMIHMALFQTRLKKLHDQKQINDRQYAIVNEVTKQGVMTLKELKQAAWYKATYSRLTDKTRSRDLKKLFDLDLLIERNGNVVPAFIRKLI